MSDICGTFHDNKVQHKVLERADKHVGISTKCHLLNTTNWEKWFSRPSAEVRSANDKQMRDIICVVITSVVRFFTSLTIGGWKVAPAVGKYISDVYHALLEEERMVYAQNLQRAFALAEEATILASQMTREEAIAAIKAGCKANGSLGWTAEEGLLDPTGWYEASLKMFDSDDIIGVYIVSHMPFDVTAYSGWQELVPSGIGCKYYGRSGFDPSEPAEGLAIFTRMVAGLLAIAPNGDSVRINDDDNAYYIKVGNAVEAEISKLSDRELAEIWFDGSVELVESFNEYEVPYSVGNLVNRILDKT